MKVAMVLQRLFVMILGVSLLAGCGGQAKPAEDQHQIAGIIFQEDQFFRLVDMGMRTAAEGAGAKYLSASTSNLLDREASLVETYISQGVDAIVISPISMKSSLPVLKRAAERGIKVVAYNTGLEGDVLDSFIESNQQDLGASTGKKVRAYIEAELGGTAKIAMIECIGGAPEQCTARSEGFLSGLGELAGVEIVARQDGFLAPKAADVVASILTAHPDLDIVWAANEGGTVGAVTAVRNSAQRDQVKVFGTDMSKQLAGFLLAEDGILQAVTGQQPFEMGVASVEAALGALAGASVEAHIVMEGVLYSRDEAGKVEAYVTELDEKIG